MNETERLTCTINEMEYAKRMGFSVVRSQDALLPETMEKLLPYADELGSTWPLSFMALMRRRRRFLKPTQELFERKNSQNLGVVTDFSAFTSGPPATVLDVFPDDLCHKGAAPQNPPSVYNDRPACRGAEQMLLSEGGMMWMCILPGIRFYGP